MADSCTRRRFLIQAAAAAGGAGASGAWAAGKPTEQASAPSSGQDKRPNILFCLADDWSWPHASLTADKVVKVPTFDRMAREGAVFRSAYVAAPSCTPSRAAILTGQWHWRLEEGSYLYGTLPAKFDVYPDLLERAGYHVGHTRKGWGPGNETAGGRKRNPAGPKFKDFDAFLAQRKAGQPFCFWFGSLDPHRGYAWESGVKGGMKAEDVNVPPYLSDCETVRKDVCDYYVEVQRFDKEVGQLLATLEKMGELDNTIVVMSGDNGWPFPRAKATLYDSGTNVPLAVRWPARVKGGRVIDDFVSLTDLAPTFLQAAGLDVPQAMTGRSLMNVLTSDKSGRVDPARDHLLTGIERHVWARRRPDGGADCYPSRCLRTHEFHYIRNFKPDRWPAGPPDAMADAARPPTYQQLCGNTFTAYADVDAGPSKAWMLLHRDEPAVAPLCRMAFDKRPERELYDVRKDPHQLHNLADDPACADTLKRLDEQLIAELTATGDPRATGRGDVFDRYPVYHGQARAPGKAKKK
ncbi:MAG: Arylsulfatase [Planctomycetes bacterium ADurb.Bin126]|nr:MAG: Arylsulfatase [Planctomycetes bacterium ADurb.Bin126]HOD81608.1 sulfatase [Phycisphaerae bacterium]HQL71930.1 sulfatase [Phycisphaerae bacterium]